MRVRTALVRAGVGLCAAAGGLVAAGAAAPGASAAGPSSFQLSGDGSHVAEGAAVGLTILRFGDMTGTVSVRYRVSPISASSPADFDATEGVLTFAPGEAEAAVFIAAKTDALVEGAELLAVDLFDPVGGSIVGLGEATVTIDDTSTPPKAYVIGTQQYEGNVGDRRELVFLIVLNKASPNIVTVDYQTKSGTARSALGDYTGVKGTVSIYPGNLSYAVSVPITGDTKVEPDERLVLLISNPTGGAVLGHGGANGTILNDDGIKAPGRV